MKDILIGILAVIIYIVILALVLALPIMLLWNWLMPDIFNLPTINLWQALGLSILSGCLFRDGKSKNKD